MIAIYRASDGVVLAVVETQSGRLAAGSRALEIPEGAEAIARSGRALLVVDGAVQAGGQDPSWVTLRGERNRLLSETDWTQLEDVPAATRAAWVAYRQALRDLPANTTDPNAPTWPSPVEKGG